MNLLMSFLYASSHKTQQLNQYKQNVGYGPFKLSKLFNCWVTICALGLKEYFNQTKDDCNLSPVFITGPMISITVGNFGNFD